MSQVNRHRQELQRPKQEETDNQHAETEEQVATESPVMAAIGHAMPRTGDKNGQVQRWMGFLQKVPGKSAQHSLFRSLQGNYGNQFTASVVRIFQQTQAPSVIQRTKIAGYTMTTHAKERQTRDDIDTPITNTDISDTIKTGKQYVDDTNATIFYKGDCAVVIRGSNIVTVYRTPRANKPKAVWTEV